QKARCRFTRLRARGQALTALDLAAAGGGEVLFDGCLIDGGGGTLIRTRGGSDVGPNVRLVRSTLLARTLLEHKGAGPQGTRPMGKVLCWDSLLCRGGTEDGDLLSLPEKATADGVEWRAVNAAYVGWRNLLTGAAPVGGKDARGWRQFNPNEGDE